MHYRDIRNIVSWRNILVQMLNGVELLPVRADAEC
jgi:hypothetical protein